MSKKSLSNGVTLKVENRSGFDKSFFNALTTGVGTITPIVKQLMIPNSSASLRLKISAQLPPLATDAFLRTHLKVEAFFVPLRLCYGGFESWFCGREVWDSANQLYTRAKLPRWTIMDPQHDDIGILSSDAAEKAAFKKWYGAGGLIDYFGIYVHDESAHIHSNAVRSFYDSNKQKSSYGVCFNIFPLIAYQLVYDEFYRNKLIESPLFSVPAARSSQGGALEKQDLTCPNLPYIACTDIVDVIASIGVDFSKIPNAEAAWINDKLLGPALDTNFRSLGGIRQRNYGDDYFTAATPNAQEGNPVEVSVSSNKFTISALRLSNALQEFAEVNNYASPDYIQTLSARYGASLKYGVAQKPVLLGSADFPMYTSGVEQTAMQTSGSVSTNNPFESVGSRYGRAHAEGTDFVCKFDADEPGYLIVNATLVPEAQYYQGNSRDMMLFNDEGSLVDLPTGLLEHIGNDPISTLELYNRGGDNVFGYVQRYLWHKLGNRNQTHGLFRMDESLGAFVVQRSFASEPSINTSFLKVRRTDLDNVSAVSSQISGFGVMIDSAIELFVSEPLSESAIPALANPAVEHGRSVYIKTGGSTLA